MYVLRASLIGMVLLLGGIQWIGALAGWYRGRSPVAYQPRRPVPWGLFDVLAVVLLLLAVLSAWVAALTISGLLPVGVNASNATPGQQAALMLAESLASLVAMLLSIALIRGRLGANWSDLGGSTNHVGRDLQLGLAGFVMLAPPVYIIQSVLIQWFESHHPLVDMLQQKSDLAGVVVSVVAAVLVAPVVEEYFFRVLLQGWLEKVAQGAHHGGELLWGQPERRWPAAELPLGASSCQAPEPQAADKLAPPPQMATGAGWDASGSVAVPVEAPAGQLPPPLWPIGVSSLVFALLHFAHGPDWVPLLVLGAGLGYLYRQTHRWLPCVVVHFLLNASSMTMFLIQLWNPAGLDG